MHKFTETHVNRMMDQQPAPAEAALPDPGPAAVPRGRQMADVLAGEEETEDFVKDKVWMAALVEPATMLMNLTPNFHYSYVEVKSGLIAAALAQIADYTEKTGMVEASSRRKAPLPQGRR